MRKSFFTVVTMALMAVFVMVQFVQAQTTIDFWTEWTEDPQYVAIEELIDKFMSENPDIKIKHRAIENEQFHTVVRTGFTAGAQPEIVQLEGFEYVIRYAKPGQLLKINDWMAENKDRFVAGLDASVTWNGDKYGIPWGGNLIMQYYYNGKVLDTYGISPPKTWREFLISCQKLKDNDMTPIAIGNKHGWPGVHWWSEILVRYVGVQKVWDLITRQPGNSWTDPEVVQAALFFQELSDWGFMSKGKASDDYAAAQALFFTGRSAYFQTGSWMVGQYKTMAPPGFEFGIAKFPEIAGGKGPNDAVMYADCFVLTTALEDPEIGYKFLDFMSRLDNQEIWVKHTQSLSPVKGAVNADTAGPYLIQIAEMMAATEDTIPHIGHIAPSPLGHGGPMYVGGVGVLTGEYDAQSWMEWLEEEAEKYEPVYTERL